MNRKDTFNEIKKIAFSTPAIDAHTHIQDDIHNFTTEKVSGNLIGTQSGINKAPDVLIEKAKADGILIRRTMLDATHSLFYSWFAEIAEGSGNKLDQAIKILGTNSIHERKKAGEFLIRELEESKYSEYGSWIRYMFKCYVKDNIDVLDVKNFSRIYDIIAERRSEKAFAETLLKSANIKAYVTSIENRDNIPFTPPIHPEDIDLDFCSYQNVWNMFDFNGFIWPERATDFGLFTQGHKFQAEKYLIHLEEYLQRDIKSVDTLRQAVKDFFYSIIRSPYSNPKSRILYVDGFQAEDWRFSDPYSQIDVDYSIRHYKDQLEGNRRKQVILCVAEAMLEALNDIGREYKKAGERFGCCLQLAGGATHFMDWSREIQSFPVNIPRLAQEEYSVWQRYPHIHFEYICAHKRLYSDLASAAKQVGNVSVGPWWHFFRRHKIAELIRDQISMGPISSIACGFTDARFVEMLAAKSQSMRLAITDVFTDLVEDEYSGLYKKVEESGKIIKKLLYSFPTQIHHIPV